MNDRVGILDRLRSSENLGDPLCIEAARAITGLADALTALVECQGRGGVPLEVWDRARNTLSDVSHQPNSKCPYYAGCQPDQCTQCWKAETAGEEMTHYERIATDARAAVDYYTDNPARASEPEAVVDLYRLIQQLAEALDGQRRMDIALNGPR